MEVSSHYDPYGTKTVVCASWWKQNNFRTSLFPFSALVTKSTILWSRVRSIESIWCCRNLLCQSDFLNVRKFDVATIRRLCVHVRLLDLILWTSLKRKEMCTFDTFSINYLCGIVTAFRFSFRSAVFFCFFIQRRMERNKNAKMKEKTIRRTHNILKGIL